MSFPIVLAIDFGTQRIGLAISRGTLAEPLRILANDKSSLSQIQKIVSDERVTQMIVGLSENEMASKTRQFVTQLKKTINLPIEFVDETLSSHSVHQKLQTASKSKRSQAIDHFAAAEFLQEYLDNITE